MMESASERMDGSHPKILAGCPELRFKNRSKNNGSKTETHGGVPRTVFATAKAVHKRINTNTNSFCKK
jgi:hypothetical protein